MEFDLKKLIEETSSARERNECVLNMFTFKKKKKKKKKSARGLDSLT